MFLITIFLGFSRVSKNCGSVGKNDAFFFFVKKSKKQGLRAKVNVLMDGIVSERVPYSSDDNSIDVSNKIFITVT